jgi:hypothetical protein
LGRTGKNAVKHQPISVLDGIGQTERRSELRPDFVHQLLAKSQQLQTRYRCPRLTLRPDRLVEACLYLFEPVEIGTRHHHARRMVGGLHPRRDRTGRT